MGKCESVPKPLKFASEMCTIQNKINGCGELGKADVEAARHIRSCDAKSLCDQAASKPLDQLKGCFSGAIEVGKEFWEAIASVPGLAEKGAENLQSCWKSEECRSSAFDASLRTARHPILLANPILAPLLMMRLNFSKEVSDQEIKKMMSTSQDLLAKGRDYLEKQGVKLACFDTKAQAEMVCYGVFSVVNPAGAAGLLAKAPKLGKLLKAAGYAKKEVGVADAATDLTRMGKLANPERITEAEKLLGRQLSPQEREALIKAHEVGSETGRGYATYSPTDLKQKADILKAAGFSATDRDQLMRKGIAGTIGDAQKARNYATTSRLQAEKLRGAGKAEESTKAFKEASDSYEVFLNDPKAGKSTRDYWMAADLNAGAGRYEKAAEYYIKSTADVKNANERAETVFERLNKEKHHLRALSFKNPQNAGTQKAYTDHKKLIEAVIKTPNFNLGDAWKRELLKP